MAVAAILSGMDINVNQDTGVVTVREDVNFTGLAGGAVSKQEAITVATNMTLAQANAARIASVDALAASSGFGAGFPIVGTALVRLR